MPARLRIPWAALLLVTAWFAGCRSADDKAPSSEARAAAAPEDSGQAVTLKYARGFAIRRRGDESWVEVRKPWQGASADFLYYLVGGDSGSGADLPPPSGASGVVKERRFRVPARRVITMTTTNLPHLEGIGALEALVGISGGAYACHPEVRARLAAGSLRELGEESALDAEAALDLRPDLVFAFAVAGWTNPALQKLEEAGLPVVLEAAYMEESPLGRAEWIRFTAEFFGRGRAADSLFAHVDSAYSALAALARGAATRPTVVVNAPRGGLWWIPGGRSYVARFLADAGADYLWADDTTRGSLNLDLEAVLARAGSADFWLNPGDSRSRAEALRHDPRHGLFKSFREGRVWNNDAARCGAGNEFFEKGSTRPDWVLADLIAIFHPELLPGHRFRWYRRLGDA